MKSGDKRGANFIINKEAKGALKVFIPSIQVFIHSFTTPHCH